MRKEGHSVDSFSIDSPVSPVRSYTPPSTARDNQEELLDLCLERFEAAKAALFQLLHRHYLDPIHEDKRKTKGLHPDLFSRIQVLHIVYSAMVEVPLNYLRQQLNELQTLLSQSDPLFGMPDFELRFAPLEKVLSYFVAQSAKDFSDDYRKLVSPCLQSEGELRQKTEREQVDERKALWVLAQDEGKKTELASEEVKERDKILQEKQQEFSVYGQLFPLAQSEAFRQQHRREVEAFVVASATRWFF